MDIRNFLDSPTTSKASPVSKLKKAAASKNQKGGGKAQDKAINKNIKPAKGGKK